MTRTVQDDDGRDKKKKRPVKSRGKKAKKAVKKAVVSTRNKKLLEKSGRGRKAAVSKSTGKTFRGKKVPSPKSLKTKKKKAGRKPTRAAQRRKKVSVKVTKREIKKRATAQLRQEKARLDRNLRSREERRQRKRKKGVTRKTKRVIEKKRRAELEAAEKANQRAFTAPEKADPSLRVLTAEERKNLAFERARSNFRALLEEAKRKAAADRVIPKPDTRKRRFRFQNGAHGAIRTVVWNREVNTDIDVEEIMYRIEQASKSIGDGVWPLWMATFFYTAMGERLVGSPKMIELERYEGVLFQELGVQGTGVMKSRIGLLEESRSLLEQVVHEDYAHTIVHLHFVEIRAYRQS